MILCAGEALIDMLPRQSTGGEDAFTPAVGGSVLNTAVALARLGAPAGLFTGLSTDLFGARLTAALEADGVDLRYAARSDRPTTLAFVALTDGQARYAFYDENTAGRMLREADLPTDVSSAQALFFGGISLAVDPCARAYEALCLRQAGRVPIMLDPNVRPGFIRDEAEYRARLERLLGVADIVKVSDEDLHWLEGPGATTDVARRMLSRGPRLVCVTEGADGATAHHAQGHLTVPTVPVEVVDTVGAGDTFNAGLLAGLAESGALTRGWLDAPDEDVLEAALTLGCRAAAVTVSRAGANPPMRSDL